MQKPTEAIVLNSMQGHIVEHHIPEHFLQRFRIIKRAHHRMIHLEDDHAHRPDIGEIVVTRVRSGRRNFGSPIARCAYDFCQDASSEIRIVSLVNP